MKPSTLTAIPLIAFALLATSCQTNELGAAYEDPRLERDRERERKATAAPKAATVGEAIPESEFSWWDEQGRVEVIDPNTRKGQREARRRMRELEYAKAQNGDSAPLRVTLDLSEQAAYFYRGKVWVGRSRVATGRSGHRTPAGEFSIIEKSREKRSNLYGRILDAEGVVIDYSADALVDEVPEGGRFVGASMPYWMRLTTDGVGMHAGPIPRPGHTASHGCIRMPRTMARTLFEKSRIGTPVTIVP